MITNGVSLLRLAPIKNMLTTKEKANGVSHGLSEAGYDIRIAQDISFDPGAHGGYPTVDNGDGGRIGRFVLASAIEEFDMPDSHMAIVHDKSTWARQGLSVFNTVIEPGWKGFLTLELVFHGNVPVHIPAGSGIAQVIFHGLFRDARYEGKYQDQENRPVPSRFEK